MTALGKVFVFLNLLLSLVVGALIVTVFATRSNWKVGYDAAVKARDAAVADSNALAKKGTDDAQRYEARIKQMQGEYDTALRERNDKIAELQNKNEQLALAQRNATTEQANSNASTIEIQKLANERDQMMAQITERNAMILKMEVAMKDFRNRAVTAEIARDATQQRHDKLMIAHETALAQLNELKSRGIVAPSSMSSRTAPVEVKGKVLGTAEDLATISLGSDHGLQIGNLLQVYRMSPTPTWVGTLQVVKTEPHHALGKFTPNGRNVIRKDDIVDSKILLK